MKRVLIIGCSGSGKTTLAQKIRARLDLPVYHLDHYIWGPGWVQRDFNEFAHEIWDLCEQDSWIMDGTYVRTLYSRIAHADTIIFLDLARWQCVWRVFKRYIRLRWQGIEIAPGCPATLNRQFLWYLWTFHKTSRPIILAMLKAVGDDEDKKIYVLKNAQAVALFITKLIDPVTMLVKIDQEKMLRKI